MPSTVTTNPSLIGKAQAMDTQAWERLHHLYLPLVQAWARRCGCDEHQSQDIAQEVFATAWCKLSQWNRTSSTGTFRGWLWTLTKNKAVDFFRSPQSRTIAEGGSSFAARLSQMPEPSDSGPHDDEPTSEDDFRLLVARAWQQVRTEFHESSQQIFERAVFDNLSTDQIAAESGKSPAAIRQIRSRIMRRMRKALGDA